MLYFDEHKFIFLVILGFELRPSCLLGRYHLSHTSSPFYPDYFGDGIWRTICLDWPQTSILLILASHVASITDVNHWHLTSCYFNEVRYFLWVIFFRSYLKIVFLPWFQAYISFFLDWALKSGPTPWTTTPTLSCDFFFFFFWNRVFPTICHK
jgi:hypothetical protein